MTIPPRRRILVVIGAALLAHLAEIALFAGGYWLMQRHSPDPDMPHHWESGEDALIVAGAAAALAAYEADARWTKPAAGATRPWTDDYTNLAGALVAQVKDRWAAGR